MKSLSEAVSMLQVAKAILRRLLKGSKVTTKRLKRNYN
jgi:hypothetical protein